MQLQAEDAKTASSRQVRVGCLDKVETKLIEAGGVPHRGIVLGTRVNNNTISQQTENDLQTQLWGIS